MKPLERRIANLEAVPPAPFGELLDSDGRQGNASPKLVAFLDSLGNSQVRSRDLPVGDSAMMDDRAGIDPDFDSMDLSGIAPDFHGAIE